MIVSFGGDGRPILLLHGLMGRARTWWPVARWLTEHGRVVGVDARGHGRNPLPGKGLRTEDFAADVAEVIERNGLAPSVVIGHSMGGLHALALAALRPELVCAVVVEDMGVDFRGRSVAPWRSYFDSWPNSFTSIAHVREFFGDAGDYFVECVTEHDDGYHLMCGIEDLYSIASEWGRRDYWDFVDRVRCPLLAIEAENGIAPAGQMAEMARRMPGGRHVVVPNSAHIVHADQPAIYRRIIEQFLADVLE